MTRIRRLPDSLINKIAAGEVVERPASVVKELVENALDAGARTVSVDLRDGGTALVRVTDDGCGMTPEEVELALERHATSKVACDEDLTAITTLGFRGEALPAICAVSRFTLVSRVPEATEGWRVSGSGGRVTQRLPVAVPVGTSVEVSDLFFNTPARLKFLRSSTTEFGLCLRHATALALAHPEVRIRLTHNGRPALNAPDTRDLRARAGAIWGWEVAERLLPVECSEYGVTVQGLVSPPELHRGGREDTVLVVNGRPVRDPTLLQAVLDAYRPLLPRDRFPLAVLTLALPPADVDANVHPTKAWVRFRQPRLVREMVARALADALRRPVVAPRVSPSPVPEERPQGSLSADRARPEGLLGEPQPVYVATVFGRLLGQVQDTFVVTASDQEVFFIDQHAAHERVVFERLQRVVASGGPVSQELLFPKPLSLSPAARTRLEQWREPLERLGFAFDGLGGPVVVLRAVPALLAAEEPGPLVEATVDALRNVQGADRAVERVLALMACRAAIKAPQALQRAEQERLVADLASTGTPFFCPHGRPTMSRIPLSEIRRGVRRMW